MTERTVFKLLEPTECSSCSWAMEPGESAVFYRGEIFCKSACVQKALSAPFEDVLGGES